VESNWSQQGLLAILHKETWGGERFYTILEKMVENVEDSFDLLELLYFILRLGFEGKYYNNKTKYEEIQNKLFYTLSNYKSRTLESLYCVPQNPVDSKHPKYYMLKLWTTIILAILSIFFVALIFKNQAEVITQPVFNKIDKINSLIKKMPKKELIPRFDIISTNKPGITE
jgi:type IV / VI secretion system protein, DotU family